MLHMRHLDTISLQSKLIIAFDYAGWPDPKFLPGKNPFARLACLSMFSGELIEGLADTGEA